MPKNSPKKRPGAKPKPVGLLLTAARTVGEASGKLAVMTGIEEAVPVPVPDSPGTGKVSSQKGTPLLTKAQRSTNQLAAAKKGARKKAATIAKSKGKPSPKGK